MCSKTVESILEFRNRQLPYLCQDDEVKPDTTFHKCLPLMLTVGAVCNLDPPEQCDCCFHQQSGEGWSDDFEVLSCNERSKFYRFLVKCLI